MFHILGGRLGRCLDVHHSINPGTFTQIDRFLSPVGTWGGYRSFCCFLEGIPSSF